MLEVALGTPSQLAAAGIVWDLLGAYVLAAGFILDDPTIRWRSTPFWDFSLVLVRGHCEQRIDARFGLSLLIIGFTLQLIAAVGVQVSWPIACLVLVPAAVVWGVYFVRSLSSFNAVTSKAARRGNC